MRTLQEVNNTMQKENQAGAFEAESPEPPFIFTPEEDLNGSWASEEITSHRQNFLSCSITLYQTSSTSHIFYWRLCGVFTSPEHPTDWCPTLQEDLIADCPKHMQQTYIVLKLTTIIGTTTLIYTLTGTIPAGETIQIFGMEIHPHNNNLRHNNYYYHCHLHTTLHKL